MPISELYQVLDSCNYSSDLEYCPVLLEIKNKDILDSKSGGKPYLLQVWDKKGTLLFERKLDSPIENWNISTDKLMFHETKDSDTIHIVYLKPNSVSTLFELTLPPGTIDVAVAQEEEVRKEDN